MVDFRGAYQFRELGSRRLRASTLRSAKTAESQALTIHSASPPRCLNLGRFFVRQYSSVNYSVRTLIGLSAGQPSCNPVRNNSPTIRQQFQQLDHGVSPRSALAQTRSRVAGCRLIGVWRPPSPGFRSAAANASTCPARSHALSSYSPGVRAEGSKRMPDEQR